MKNKTNKTNNELHPNPLNLSARFLAARPSLVSAWIIGAHGLLPIFKSEYKEAIITFLETAEHEFFSALNNQVRKRVPGLELYGYYLGSIIKNRKTGKERMIIGIIPADPKDIYSQIYYDYISDNGKVSCCSGATLQSWQWK